MAVARVVLPLLCLLAIYGCLVNGQIDCDTANTTLMMDTSCDWDYLTFLTSASGIVIEQSAIDRVCGNDSCLSKIMDFNEACSEVGSMIVIKGGGTSQNDTEPA